jgi:hypothetical protein
MDMVQAVLLGVGAAFLILLVVLIGLFIGIALTVI